MKKYILILLSVVAVGLSSCKKDTIITESANRSIVVDIAPTSWAPSSDGLYYSTRIDVPENNANFNQIGHVAASIAFDNPDVYEALPQTFEGVSYTYTSSPGQVILYINSVNNNVRPARPTGITTVKIVLIDAVPIN